MKAVLPKQIGDKIEGRANSKGATVKGRHYVIGTARLIEVGFHNRAPRLAFIPS